MNRKMKFRVWDKAWGLFVDKTALGDIFLINQNGELFGFDDSCGTLHKVNNENYITNQSTELLDKNGKEIYEGDIIKSTVSVGPNIREQWKNIKLSPSASTNFREVVWGEYDDGEYVSAIECWMIGGDSLSELITRTKAKYQEFIREYEVVGNIFENHELLNGKA